MIMAFPVHLLCVITNQNACTHSTSCSQHYVKTPMQNIMFLLISRVTFRTVSLSKSF